MDTWLQVQVNATGSQVDALETWLFRAGALSVTLLDASTDDDLSHAVLEPLPGETPVWADVLLSGLFAQDVDPEMLHEALQLAAIAEGAEVPAYRLHTLDDQPWERLWLERFKPVQFADHLWVCPLHAEAPDPEAVNLRLDPGLAFGTGSHPTTALCLQWLGMQSTGCKAPLAGKRVIDYGCGSGVLAIASLLLGAEHAWAVDIDEQALQATRDNATINQVEDRLEVGQPTLLTGKTADILLANILYQPLIELADELAGLVSTDGRIVISGILEEQIEQTRMRYNNCFSQFGCQVLDGWCRLTATRCVGSGNSD